MLQKLMNIIEQYGSGNPQFDLSLVLFVLIAFAIGLIALSLFAGGRKKKSSLDTISEGRDRLTALAGKFEKLEMNANSSRTELRREVELLKGRVEKLEQGAGIAFTPPVGDPEILETDEGVAVSSADDIEQNSIEMAAPKGMKIDKPSDDVGGLSESVASEDRVASEERVARKDRELKDEKSAEPKSLSSGLTKTRSGFFRKMREVFSGRSVIDEETLEELQAFLVSADLGLKMVDSLIERLREDVRRGDAVTEEALLETLRANVSTRLQQVGLEVHPIEPTRRDGGPTVVMMVGVNGVGKTTSTAKLALQWKLKGAKVLMVGADTFRAAASLQLQKWGEELDIAVHVGDEGAKPAAVVYDAMEKANMEQYDVVLIDTAGRLHTKGNLMQELEGIKNIVRKSQPDAPHEILLVIDGTTGQNALQQAQEFHSSVRLTGLVVTKLDGTARGGMVVAVQDELGVPVRYIGIGEAAEDLRLFEVSSFIAALFNREDISELSAPSAHAKRRRRRREENHEAVAETFS